MRIHPRTNVDFAQQKVTRGRRGMAVMSVLVTLFVVTILSGLMVQRLFQRRQLARTDQLRRQGVLLAEIACEQAAAGKPLSTPQDSAAETDSAESVWKPTFEHLTVIVRTKRVEDEGRLVIQSVATLTADDGQCVVSVCQMPAANQSPAKTPAKAVP